MSESKYDPFDTRTLDELKAEADLQARLDRETEEADLKWLMSSKRGRRIVWRLLALTGVFQLSFNTVAMTMSFNEGRRAFGNRMLNLVFQVCPELFTTMQKEAQDGSSTPTNR